MKRSDFTITKMDCPSEEQMIRMKLEKFGQIKYLDFDIPKRKLSVYHEEEVTPIDRALDSLNFNSTLDATTDDASLPENCL